MQISAGVVYIAPVSSHDGCLPPRDKSRMHVELLTGLLQPSLLVSDIGLNKRRSSTRNFSIGPIQAKFAYVGKQSVTVKF